MTGPLRRLLPRGRPVRRTTALAVLAGTATVCCGIGLFGAAGWLIARAAEQPDIEALAVAIVAVRGLGIGRVVCRYAERVLTHDAAMRGLSEVRPSVFARLVALVPAGVPMHSGDLLARVVGDVDAVQDLLVRVVTPVATAVLAGSAAVLLTAALDPASSVVLCLGLLVAGAGVPWLVAALSRGSGPAATDQRARLSAQVAGTLDGAADLLACGAERRALAASADASARQSALARAAARTSGVGAGLAVLVAGGTLWAVAGLATTATRSGRLDSVVLAVVVLVAIAAFEVVTTLPSAAAALGSARRSARRLVEVLDAPDPVRVPEHPAPLPAGRLAIRLAGVAVRYGPDGPWALRGVDLDLPPGRRVAVVGPSGSGKSSLVSVLLRFRDADRGCMSVGGEDVRRFDPDDVRRRIGGSPADPHVFAGSLRQNLELARPGASAAELDDAARRARLLDWVDSLPDGWETAVGHRGAAMSGGERQRLALARALLADVEVLVMDEPTAHLDPATAAAVTATLLAATRGRTAVLVTHDLDLLPEVDEVLVLDAGRVVQRGAHRELIDRPGPYRAMWTAQAADTPSR